MIQWGANFGPKTLAGEEWRLATCMFLHFGAAHLGMNMLTLWSVGGFVERLFGRIGFLLLYAVSGLAGSFASVLFNPSAVSAGASGAIFGVAGGLLGGAWKIRKTLPPALGASVRGMGFTILLLLVIFGVVNHFYPMIDNAAHVAGLSAGVLIGLILAEPVPNPNPSRRGWRNLLVACLGTAAGYLGYSMLPEPPTDFNELQTRFLRVERVTDRTAESAHERAGAGAITTDELADLLEKYVLYRWTDLREDLESAGWVPKEQRELVADLRKAAEHREAGWQLHIEALRERNPRKDEDAQRQFDEALEILRQLNEKVKKLNDA
jgi:membrane associated rhomboid family serine protease